MTFGQTILIVLGVLSILSYPPIIGMAIKFAKEDIRCHESLVKVIFGSVFWISLAPILFYTIVVIEFIDRIE